MKLDLAEYLPGNTVERSVAPLRPRRRIPTLWAAGILLVVLLLLAALLPFLISAVYVAAGARLLSADSAGNPALAAAYFERAHEWSPADPEIDRALARAHLRLTQPQAAIDALERAYQRRPESLLIQQELARAYEAGGQVQRADAMWLALGLSGHDMLARGEQARRLKSYTEAIAWYKRAGRALPHAVEPLYYAGLAYREAGQLDQALQVLQQAGVQAPNNRNVWYELGQTYAARVEWPQALEAYRRGLDARTGQVGRSNFYYRIGYIRQYVRALRDIDGAWEAYEQALAIADFQTEPLLKSDVFYQKGVIRAGRNYWATAVEEYQRALALNPRHYIGHVALADALSHLGQRDAAEARLLQAIDLAPARKEAYRSLGALYRDVGDTAGARAMFSRVLAIDDQDVAARKILEALP